MIQTIQVAAKMREVHLDHIPVLNRINNIWKELHRLLLNQTRILSMAEQAPVPRLLHLQRILNNLQFNLHSKMLHKLNPSLDTLHPTHRLQHNTLPQTLKRSHLIGHGLNLNKVKFKRRLQPAHNRFHCTDLIPLPSAAFDAIYIKFVSSILFHGDVLVQRILYIYLVFNFYWLCRWIRGVWNLSFLRTLVEKIWFLAIGNYYIIRLGWNWGLATGLIFFTHFTYYYCSYIIRREGICKGGIREGRLFISGNLMAK